VPVGKLRQGTRRLPSVRGRAGTALSPRSGGGYATGPATPAAGANRSPSPRRPILDRHRRGAAPEVSQRPADLGALPAARGSRPAGPVRSVRPRQSLPRRRPAGGAGSQAGAPALGRRPDPAAVSRAVSRTARAQRADLAALVLSGRAPAGPGPTPAGAAGTGPGGARGLGDRRQRADAAGGWERDQCIDGDR
jgi:hypothetical protein